MFNHSKARQKSQNDASKPTKKHSGSGMDTAGKNTDLICGYLFSESENRLYSFSGQCKGGELEIDKSKINVGNDAILHWSAFLVQVANQREHPTPYSEVLGSMGVPGFGKTDDNLLAVEMPSNSKPYNYSRSADGITNDVSIKAYGTGAMSEVSTEFDGDDLVIHTKTTLFGGRNHVRQDGLTNYIVYAVQDLINRAADRIVAILESKSKNGEGTDKEPVFPWARHLGQT